MWTSAQLKQWRHLFRLNARKRYDLALQQGRLSEEAERLRELGWSPQRAAAQVYAALEERA